MSINTLYSSFKKSVQASKDIDILGSEVGTKVTESLDSLEPVKQALGQDWKVTGARIPQEDLVQEQRQKTLKILVVPAETWIYHKRRFNGTFKTYTQTKPARYRTDTLTYHVPVVSFFQLDGRIGTTAQFFAHFWNDSGTLKFYMVFGFGDTAIEGAFFKDAYWPERTSHTLARPRVLVFSHPMAATFGRDWQAGAFLLMEAEYGPKLKAAATGTDRPMKLGGSLGVESRQFTFDLVSSPKRSLTFDGGKVVIEDVTLSAKTEAWVDGEPPRTIEGEEAEDDDEDVGMTGTPEPHDVQFSLAGKLKVSEDLKIPVWTPFTADTGVACWRAGSQLGPLAKASLLDGILGKQKWLESFGGDLESFTLEAFEVTVDQPLRSALYVSYVLQGKITFNNIGPDPLTIPETRITCTVDFPWAGPRREDVEIEGTLSAYGAKFHLHWELAADRATLTSADGEGFDKWSRSFWYEKRRSDVGFNDSEIQGKFDCLHVYLDLAKPAFTASVSDEEGNARDI